MEQGPPKRNSPPIRNSPSKIQLTKEELALIPNIENYIMSENSFLQQYLDKRWQFRVDINRIKHNYQLLQQVVRQISEFKAQSQLEIFCSSGYRNVQKIQLNEKQRQYLKKKVNTSDFYLDIVFVETGQIDKTFKQELQVICDHIQSLFLEQFARRNSLIKQKLQIYLDREKNSMNKHIKSSQSTRFNQQALQKKNLEINLQGLNLNRNSNKAFKQSSKKDYKYLMYPPKIVENYVDVISKQYDIASESQDQQTCLIQKKKQKQPTQLNFQQNIKNDKYKKDKLL